KGLQNGDRAAFGEWRFLVTSDVAKGLLFSLHKIDHCASDGLFAFERGNARTFAHGHPALVDLSHLGRLDRLVTSLVVDYQERLVGNDLIFIEQLLRPGKIALGVNVLDIDFSPPSILVFRQQILNISTNRRSRWEENSDAHLAFECVKETLRL